MAVAIWAALAAVLAVHALLPTIVVVVMLAVLSAWYGSLQHEVIHGHPTPWANLNTAFAVVPLGLVMPFATYRDIHLAHHRSPELTDPILDPESFHVDAETWARCGSLRRSVLRFLRTLSGRMILGPLLAAVLCWGRLVKEARTAVGARRLLVHLVAVGIILAIVVAAGMSPWVFVVGAAWGGGALTMLRSFAEHRWTTSGTRSAVIQAGPGMALLFLNNNLHHTHHARPAEPWFRLPAVHRQLDSDQEAAAGAGLYRGYTDIARRYLWRPFDAPVRTPAHSAVTAP